MKRYFTIVISILFGIAIGISGSAIFHKHHEQNISYSKNNTANSESEMQNLAQTTYPPIKISQQAALYDFHRLYSQAKVNSITLKTEHDSYIYEIEGYDDKKSASIKINAENGEIVGQSTVVNSFTETEQTTLNFKKLLSRQNASRIAEASLKNSRAREWHLYYDAEIDRTIWQIKLVDGQEVRDVKVDANTKQIISSKN